jgi:hypothetical protein
MPEALSMLSTRHILSLSLAAGIVLGSTPAFADDAACLVAASKGQRFRATHKLVEARTQLRICAASACPPVVQTDCAGWLASTEKALPSVVVTAKDNTGANLTGVQVTVDGQPFATRLEGEAVPINPGSHTFHFEGPDGATLDQVVVAAEGEQNQRVAVVLTRKTPGPQAPPSSSSPSAAESGGANADAGTTQPGPSGGAGAWKTIGWVAGGVGIVGLGVGTAFGMMAIGDHDSAKCNAQNVCFTDKLNDARSAATVADVGFIAGGVLLAAGLGLVLLAPGGGSGEDHRATTAVLTPVLAPGGGGWAVGGTWW